MQNLNVLEIKYLAFTNTKGARISIFSPRFKQRTIITFDYWFNTIEEGATAHLESLGFNILYCGEGKDKMYLMSDTFKPLKVV